MEMTNKEFSSHFSDTFTPEIKAFGRETLLKEGFDCLIVTDKEDKENSPRTAWRRERDSHYCTAAYLNIPEEELRRREAYKARKEATCPSCKYTLSVYHQWRMDMSQLDSIISGVWT